MEASSSPLAKIRTDVVGSLLRPARLKEAHSAKEQGKISEEDLRRTEDDTIREAVRFQESLGLDVITDGEYRRLNFQDSFAASVTGFAARQVDLSFMESLSREGKPLQRWDPYQIAGEGDAGRARSDYTALRLPKLEIGVLEHGRLRCGCRAHRTGDRTKPGGRGMPIRSD